MANFFRAYIDDPGDGGLSPPDAKASIGPVRNPADDQEIIYWCYGAKPRSYKPYFVRVREIADGEITFWLCSPDLLPGQTAPTELHKNPITERLSRGDRVWNELPSTAHLVQPGEKILIYGFLFLTDSYIGLLIDQGFISSATLAAFGPSDGPGKWPRGTGGAARAGVAGAIDKLHDLKKSNTQLNEAQQLQLQKFLDVLK